MPSLRRRRVLICLAVIICLAGICAPGGRSFAASIVTRLADLRLPVTASGPIPYILDLRKHKPAPTRAATSNGAAKPKPAASKAAGQPGT